MSVVNATPPEVPKSRADDAARRRAGGVAQILVQLSRRVLERRDAEDLHAAQWSALRYYARAGRRSANVMGLATYLGNTTGSASRTVRSLVERGLIARTPLREDARSTYLALTPAGEATLANDPLNEVTDAIASLSAADLDRLGDALDAVSQSLAASRG